MIKKGKIAYEAFELSNGLRVVVHEDPTVQIAVLNLMYDVGSKDEDAKKTGFAHLFEHLMFGGSENIPEFDTALQKVGGENNAFTSPDLTNYYMTVPANNLETAFWLESDRMLSLSFDPEVLEIQRKVVIEEFKQRYLNQPYGDIWLKFRPVCYQKHPYRWPTIGKEIDHIEKATMEDVKNFFHQFYVPNNAVLVVGGNVKVEQVRKLAEKWFGSIPTGKPYHRNLSVEPPQTTKRVLEIEAEVPVSLFYKAYHMCGKKDENYYAADLLSDVIGRGKSSRIHKTLVEDKRLLTAANGYVMGSTDPGLLILSGYLRNGVTFQEVETAVDEVVKDIQNHITDEEIQKVKNQAESSLEFGRVEVLERCINLAYNTLLGNTELINEEQSKIASVTKEDIFTQAKTILREENSSILRYQSIKK